LILCAFNLEDARVECYADRPSTMATHDVEKLDTAPVEKEHVLTSPAASSKADGFETEFTPREQKKIIHRVDRRLVVTVGVLYCISLMDRTNLSAASIAGYAFAPYLLARMPLLTWN
jgi:hypothetical protein